jgi:transcriptional regulator with XRE-family HTH domain
MARTGRTPSPSSREPPGANIRRLRDQRDWTLRDLQAAIERRTQSSVAYTQIHRIERGASCTLDTLRLIAAGLSVELPALFADEESLDYLGLPEEARAKVRVYVADLRAAYNARHTGPD